VISSKPTVIFFFNTFAQTVLMVWLVELPYSLIVSLLRSVKVLHLMSHVVYC